MYTVTDAALPEIPKDVLNWTRKNLRTYMYPPEWEHFMYALRNLKATDEQLLALLPQQRHWIEQVHTVFGEYNS